MAEQPLREWKSGLLDCFEDVNTCCYGFWCCPCLAGTVSNRFGENYLLPLCDICPLLTASCGIPVCIPPASLSLRTAMRNKNGIKGSICKDIAATGCCLWCSWCQMHRELTDRNRAVIVNVQMPQVVGMQPVPVMQPPQFVSMQPAPMMMAPQSQQVVINTQ